MFLFVHPNDYKEKKKNILSREGLEPSTPGGFKSFSGQYVLFLFIIIWVHKKENFNIYINNQITLHLMQLYYEDYVMFL